MMFRFLPSKAALYALVGAMASACLAWLRWDAKQDVTRELEVKDYENAEEINGRVSRAADPERLRKYSKRGRRD